MIKGHGGNLVVAVTAVLLASSVCKTVVATAQGAAQQPLSAKLGVYVFPTKGQSASQQTLDENGCFNWAKAQSGFDPFSLQASQPAPPPPNPQAAAAAGQGSAVKGTAAGAAIGGIAGDAGKGAAIGATVGLVQRRRLQKQAEAQQEAQHESSSAASSAALTQARASYNKAFSVCMEGKGYAVK